MANRVLIVAHRGGSSSTENSIESFRHAQEIGCDSVECDVHATADGKLVVMHDSNLLRTTGKSVEISRMNAVELNSIRLRNGEKIPLLQDVFGAIDIPVVIEIKSVNVMKGLIQFFTEKQEYRKRSVAVSFFHEAILNVKNKIPDIKTGAILAGFPVNPECIVRDSRADSMLLNYEGLTESYVAKCHERNINVGVWAPDSMESIKDMIDAGVDAIGTDKPEIALQLLRK